MYSDFNSKKFEEVLEESCLKKDLEELDFGCDTEIGIFFIIFVKYIMQTLNNFNYSIR